MLKNIHLHIEKNNNKQEELEVALAKHITQTQKDNINAFQRHIPSVVDIIKHSHSQNISVFCNK
ncbi:hypothetical protein, partial [Paraglaciecola sp.]|uniref:hypothetical protein n=1 Tax=Paraglaciecola sp. TaxID=1920173 RepID=UPI003EF7CFCD